MTWKEAEMSKMLAVISVIGLLLCATLLGGAWALGGDEVFHDPRSLQGLKPLIDMATRKEWRWAGGDTLALDTPMTLRYEPQGKPNVSVTGPAEAVKHVRFSSGRIGADMGAPRGEGRVQAVVSGVPIRKFVVNGGEHLELGQIDQEKLSLNINGAGVVSGGGKVGQLTLIMTGPGKAELGDLLVKDAKITILGPGKATVSPSGELKVFVAGTGHVTLKTQPVSIERSIWGGGVIETPRGIYGTKPSRGSNEALPPTADATPGPAATPPNSMLRTSGAGRPPNRLSVRGGERLNLGYIDQDRLTVDITDNGSFTANGQVDRLEVNVMGTGSADLGALTARRVKVFIASSGYAVVAPTQEVRVNISGSGNVRLTTRPEQIERQIAGSGRVIEAP
jgi:hypothetical protein